ncbi:protein of unknown function [Nitrospina watsonii]|uniref:Uncharacterized protein n=1 Tax=Nitrospina watsonii TaxID=1323948 RepID=A0ABM9HGF4_9BACT|nr:protein of unknown function [Nitrospina watsonii]
MSAPIKGEGEFKVPSPQVGEG